MRHTRRRAGTRLRELSPFAGAGIIFGADDAAQPNQENVTGRAFMTAGS
jgi:hypothetical protein